MDNDGLVEKVVRSLDLVFADTGVPLVVILNNARLT